ncbi:MAG: ATP/GTP-binding protein [Nitrososphaerota archaeon]|nr:ATP/GTP-binding protein [Nitrososphaerota archaeon]
MYAIFITGTAGSGKSLLTSCLVQWFNEKGSYAITVNLDPGALNLPYEPDVDIREYIDIQAIMDAYQLGPNGALIFATDLIATRFQEIQDDIDSLAPDYAIIDTPGQVELFAYRSNGPYIVKNIRCDERVILFLFDSMLVSTPVNFISIALLDASIQLRLRAPHIPLLSKKDLAGDNWKKILKWASDRAALESAIREEAYADSYLLGSSILRDLARIGFSYELIPVSAVTREGMVELSAVLTRIFKGGEEVED